MTTILSFLLILIFFLIALLHFYWAAGGRWGANAAAPTNKKGEKLLNTGPIPSLVVGIGLLLFAFYYLPIQLLPVEAYQVIGWIIPSIFLVRAIGEFKYVGLFKKLKTSVFAIHDTKYFTPLCLVISSLGFAVRLLN